MNTLPRALVKRSLAELIPKYMNNRRKDLAQARAALAAADLVTLKGIGHRLKGSGSGYGFHEITALGARLEQASLRGDIGTVAELIRDLDEYLRSVQIELV